MSNLNVTPTVKPNNPKLDGLRQLIKGIEDKSMLHAEDVKPVIPWYNASIHRAGDTVRMMQRNREVVVTIPLIDAEGYSYED